LVNTEIRYNRSDAQAVLSTKHNTSRARKGDTCNYLS